MGWEALSHIRTNRLAVVRRVHALATTGRAHGIEPSGAAANVSVLPLCHVPAHAFRACRAGFLKQMFVEAIVNILNIYRQPHRRTTPVIMEGRI